MAFRIKYCGGCNPSYARTELVRQVGEILNEDAVYGSDDDAHPVVYISGCHRRCVGGGDGVIVFSDTPAEIVAQEILEKRGVLYNDKQS